MGQQTTRNLFGFISIFFLISFSDVFLRFILFSRPFSLVWSCFIATWRNVQAIEENRLTLYVSFIICYGRIEDVGYENDTNAVHNVPTFASRRYLTKRVATHPHHQVNNNTIYKSQLANQAERNRLKLESQPHSIASRQKSLNFQLPPTIFFEKIK